MSAGWDCSFPHPHPHPVHRWASMGRMVGMAYTLVHFGSCMYDLHTACARVVVRGRPRRTKSSPTNQVEDDERTKRASPPHTYTYTNMSGAHTQREWREATTVRVRPGERMNDTPLCVRACEGCRFLDEAAKPKTESRVVQTERIAARVRK